MAHTAAAEQVEEQAAPITLNTAITLDEDQQRAVALCCDPKQRVVGVTGPAGTGKTTIMRFSYEGLRRAGYGVSLCSPTGKAAKRIHEATGIRAMTIHRLLEFTAPSDIDEKTGQPVGVTMPRRDRGNPLPDDVIIVDEYSMVNRELHSCLIAAMKPGSRLIGFGDLNQLRPIEDDAVRGAKKETPFEALLRKFPHVKLTHVHRTDEQSGILWNAQRVLRRMACGPKSDFAVVVTENQTAAIEDYATRDDNQFARLDCQIIVPMKKSILGTGKLNGMLQNIYEPEIAMPAYNIPRHKWDAQFPMRVRSGTKVIQVENNYDLNVFNGETGIVTGVDAFGMQVDFGDRIVEYPRDFVVPDAYGGKRIYDPRMGLHLAYAITTHKAQGSEFDHVMYIMGRPMQYMQTRSNLYTGITRARKQVTLITDQRSNVSAPMAEER